MAIRCGRGLCGEPAVRVVAYAGKRDDGEPFVRAVQPECERCSAGKVAFWRIPAEAGEAAGDPIWPKEEPKQEPKQRLEAAWLESLLAAARAVVDQGRLAERGDFGTSVEVPLPAVAQLQARLTEAAGLRAGTGGLDAAAARLDRATDREYALACEARQKHEALERLAGLYESEHWPEPRPPWVTEALRDGDFWRGLGRARALTAALRGAEWNGQYERCPDCCARREEGHSDACGIAAALADPGPDDAWETTGLRASGPGWTATVNRCGDGWGYTVHYHVGGGARSACGEAETEALARAAAERCARERASAPGKGEG